jgi:hypothetical protein
MKRAKAGSLAVSLLEVTDMHVLLLERCEGEHIYRRVGLAEGERPIFSIWQERFRRAGERKRILGLINS